MTDPLMTDPLRLAFTWRYRHPLGDLAPFLAALAEGRALAARCPACARAWFPPRPDCPDHGALEWAALPGSGTAIAVTESALALPPDGAPAPCRIALVRMDGAENAAVGPVVGDGPVAIGSRLRLAPPEGPLAHPIQAMRFRAER